MAMFEREQAQFALGIMGITASVFCFVLGYPCVVGLPSAAFRLTCVGFFVFSALGLLARGAQEKARAFRFALVSNYVSAWVVSGWWCFSFRAWMCLMVAEHIFQVLGTSLLVGDHTAEHLLFTAAGSAVFYAFTSHVETLLELDSRAHAADQGAWAFMVIVMVIALVSGMTAAGFIGISGFRRKINVLWAVLTIPVNEFEATEQAQGSILPAIEHRSPKSSLSGERETQLSGLDETSAITRTPATSSTKGINALKPARPPFEDVALKKQIGEGSFGKVYYGEWMGSPVAVKVVRLDTKKNNVQPLFEAQLSAALSHPCLVQTYKFSSVEEEDKSPGCADCMLDSLWIVLEWCDKGTLRNYCSVPRTSRQDLREVCEMFTEISSAGAYLHSRGIIHGDLTANNVLLKSNLSWKGYGCKVCDFGLARVLEGETSAILTAQLGTVTHMPPELFQLDPQQARLTPKVDVYSSGVLLWQAVTGKIPFQGLLLPQIILKVSRGSRLQLPDELEECVKEIFNRCTEPDPDNRPLFDELVKFFTEQAQVLV